MKKYIYISLIILSLLAVIGWQRASIRAISKDRNIYRKDVYTLMDDIKIYKTKDSLNVASVGQLELKLSELNRFRAEDMKLIETLQVDKKRLLQITTAQTQTIYELHGTFHEKIDYSDSLKIKVDTLRCIAIENYWYDMTGCINKNFEFDGTFEDRQEVKYIEHIVPKKFLFIKWGCKERRQEIVLLNPHSKITKAEYITIRK